MEDIDRTYYKLQPAKFADVLLEIMKDASATNNKVFVINAQTFAPCIADIYHETIINHGWTIANFNRALDRYGTK